MSKLQARAALDQLVGRPALISPTYAGAAIGVASEVTSGALFADLRELADAVMVDEVAATGDRNRLMASSYGYDIADENSKPFVFANGYAIIPVHGLLINRFSYSWSFVTGYNFLRNQITAARADDDVTALIFDVNTCGGMVSGCQETADLLFEANAANGGKPCIAVVDANCMSAGYFLASQCDHIAVTPSGIVGSIGVLRMHFDLSKMLDDAGVKVSFIIAGAHKVDGNQFEPLSDEVRAEFQDDIDDTYDVFVSTVVRGRGITDETVRGTEARSYSAADALALGLVDAIQNPPDAVEAYFCTDDSGDDDGAGDDPDADPPNEQENADMKPVTPTGTVKPGVAAPAAPAEVTSENVTQAAADARVAERTRIQGIQGHAEAVGREAVAQHLALNTDLDIDTAVGILAVTPKAAPAEAAAAPAAPTAPAASEFQRAMDAGTQPNVGASGGTGTDGEQTPAQRMLSTQMKVSGPTRPAAPTRH